MYLLKRDRFCFEKVLQCRIYHIYIAPFSLACGRQGLGRCVYECQKLFQHLSGNGSEVRGGDWWFEVEKEPSPARSIKWQLLSSSFLQEKEDEEDGRFVSTMNPTPSARTSLFLYFSI